MLEREWELERSREVIERARAGEGSVLAVAGPPGIGKTRLIGAVSEVARDHGCEVLAARGAELEGGFPFGIARQLLEPPVHAASPARRDELLSGAAELAAHVLGQEPEAPGSVTDPTFAALHGLYWVAANLASEAPTVLAIDDAHWSDAESIRWLRYLSHRLDGLPMAVVVGVCPGEPGARANAIGALLSEPIAGLIEPAPLSAEAVGELAAAALAIPADPEFAAACHRASGGNPFLAQQLLTALAEAGVEPTAANADRALATGPETVRRAVLARLARLPAACSALATSLAIVEEGVELRALSEFAGLDLDQAIEAADLLVAAGIVAPTSPPQFLHEILRASIDPRPDTDPPRINTQNLPRVCTRKDFRLRVRIRDESRINRVRAFLNGRQGQRLQRSRPNRKRFHVKVPARQLSSGRHRIRIVARDAAGNSAREVVTFRRCARPTPRPPQLTG